MNIMIEEWKIIKEFPKYKINRKGEVYSTTNNCILTTRIKKGRVVVRLSKNDKKYERFISRLLAIAFIPNPENKSQVNHIDENPLNNNLDNLEWTTPKENTNHGTRNERAGKSVSEVSGKKIYQYNLDGQFIRSYKKLVLVEKYGFNFGNVDLVARGDKNRKTAHGFIWSYNKLH